MNDLFKFSGAELSNDGRYRYRLWRQWREGNRLLLWIMLNPSTADADRDDATIRRCITFSKREGYDGLRVCNLFAFRSTNPKGLMATPNPIGAGNTEVLRSEAVSSSGVIAAWGCVPTALAPRADEVLAVLADERLKVLCLGTTAEGWPRHPVRLANATPFELYRGIDRT